MPNSGFKWTSQRENAAIALAEGRQRSDAAELANVSERSIYKWLNDPEFAAEVDRLSLMIDIASKAERLRIARRVIREKLLEDELSSRDLLEWLKFAREEVEGVKLDIDITTVIKNAVAVANGEQTGDR